MIEVGYCIYERSKDGLIKEVEIDEPYGYISGFYDPYETEEEAIEAIERKFGHEKFVHRDFLILKEIKVKKYSEEG